MSALPAIRAAVPADAARLAEFGARCFSETYAPDNDPADMTAHLARTYSPEIQGRELADPRMRCVLADADGEVVGYALLAERAGPPEVKSASPWELKRFYVDHRWHGRGLAGALMREAVAIARRARATAVWLTAWEENGRACAFYSKMGFADVGTATFMLGSAPQVDRLFVLELA